MQEVRAVPGFSSRRKVNILSIDLEPILTTAYAVWKSKQAWCLITTDPLYMLDLNGEPMITIKAAFTRKLNETKWNWTELPLNCHQTICANHHASCSFLAHERCFELLVLNIVHTIISCIFRRRMVCMTTLMFQSFSMFGRERKRFENISKHFEVRFHFRFRVRFLHYRVNDSSRFLSNPGALRCNPA